MAETSLVNIEKYTPADLFKSEPMNQLIAQIYVEARKHVPDLTTAAGRKAVASNAFRVSSTKVLLDNVGKKLVEDWKIQAKEVDAIRKTMRDALDVLRDEVRMPLTEYENEQARLEEIARQEALYDAAWDEAHQMHNLFERERIVREKEAAIAKADAERKAKEAAEAEERQLQERAARIAAEAVERAKKEAAERVRLAEERAAKAERDRIVAAAKAKADQEAAGREAVKKAQEENDRKEQARLAAEQAERQKQERLAENKRHRARIQGEIVMDILAVCRGEGMSLEEQTAEAIIRYVDTNLIRHVQINY